MSPLAEAATTVRRSSRARGSLLARFGVLSLVSFCLIGVLLGQMLQASLREQVLERAVAEAEVVARLGLQDAIGYDEVVGGLSEDRARAVQLDVRADFARTDVIDLVVWNLDGVVVFASDSTLRGRDDVSSTGLRDALAGAVVAVVADTTSDDNGTRRREGAVLDVYQPLLSGTLGARAVSGAVRTSVPYAPLAEDIASGTRRLVLVLAAGLGLLYGVLFRQVANASSELRRRADDSEHQARHDALTGLGNRTLFTEELRASLASRGGSRLAVALMDLDRFKDVNDTLGHHHGDLLLVEVGRRLERALRPTDTVVRLGGDEFALLLADVADGAAAEVVARKVLTEVEQPFEHGGLQLDVGASLGIAVAPVHGDDVVTLLQHADVAMYQAKREGTGCVVYDPTGDSNSRELLELASDLRRTMHDQLVVHFQPKVDLASGRVSGFEALVRWEHPEHGLLLPDRFLPIAERSGQLTELTRVVLAQSLAQLRRWRDDGLDLHVAVNVSAAELHDERLARDVVRLLATHDCPPETLVLEVTETTIAADPAAAGQVLRHLRDLGVRVSIDDFGTGYSSLAMLRSLPASELKIDRHFVRDLAEEDGAAIVQFSVQLGHTLGMTVVAEGVEDTGVADELRRLGCDLVQGYGVGRPMPGVRASAWLDEVGVPRTLRPVEAGA